MARKELSEEFHNLTWQGLISLFSNSYFSITKRGQEPKQLLKVAARLLPMAGPLPGIGTIATGVGAVATDKNIDVAVDAVAASKERLQPLLQQHHVTKKDQSLQQLMRAPAQRLTKAFVEDLIAQASDKPIIICFDTFEKAPLEINRWLCQYLLGQSQLRKHRIRIVVAGQQCLTQKEEWRKLEQDCDLIFEKTLERFSDKETQAYLQEIHWTETDDIQKILQITGGLPYYLNWIRKKVQKGEKIELSQGNKAVSDLLLQGKTQEQRMVVQIVACCRWFDRTLVQELLRQGELSSGTDIAQDFDWFDWLKSQHYVAPGKSQFDDVARDVFQKLLRQEDRSRFRNVHLVLAQHYQNRADQIMAPDCSEPARYDNPDWCQAITEYLYHLLLSEQNDRHVQFLNHLFASHYLNAFDVVTNVFVALTSDQVLLSDATQQWIQEINILSSGILGVRVSQVLSWLREKENLQTEDQAHTEEIESAIEALGTQLQSGLSDAFDHCRQYVEPLEGVGKYVFLLYQSKMCSMPTQRSWLKKAEVEANKLADDATTDFSSSLFLWDLGKDYFELELFEEAIASYDKALEFKPDKDQAWYNRGVALGNLGRYEDEIASYDKALQFKPDKDEAWYNRGVALGNLGRFEDAIASYDKALEFKPDKDEAWYNRGVALGNLGRYEDEIASYDKALQFKPDLDQAWYNRGIALRQLGRFEDAIASYDKALEFKLDKDEAWYNRGVALRQLGRYEDAISSYDKALEFKPDKDEAWYNRGVALRQLGRYEDAISSYDKALEFKPDKDEAWTNRGVALGNLGRFEDAISSYDKALEFKPDGDQAWTNRGVALGNLGRFEDAISSYDKALQFKPDKDEAWYNRGVALGNLGRFEDAIASYDKALEFKPDDDQAWNNRGVALGNLGRFEDAIASYDKALEFKPDDDQAWNNRGVALGNLGRFEDAIASYDKALQFKPDKDEAWYNRGIALRNLGRFEDAIASYDKALQFKPDKDEAWNNRGWALDELGRYDDAIASYDKALQFKPEDDQAFHNRGFALEKLGRYEDAISSYDKALQFKPDKDQAWTNRGVALGNLGRFNDAIASYDKALQFKPEDDQAFHNRGFALEKLGRYEDAISSYDKALQFKPEDDQAFYNKACCYALQAKPEAAIENLKIALSLAPDKYREMAKTDSDFDSIRHNEAFQALLTF
ncbi:tetratricopeptide repeat protein [Acaryochloris sp. 'Moss Beach']|nr:tetratricopeptide repeat protein [Acaryochloris sp. 'Moss Beach']